MKRKLQEDEVKRNRDTITESGIPCSKSHFGGLKYMFREAGKLKVDFFPSSNKWRVFRPGNVQTIIRGDATKFLEWYTTINTGESDE